MGREALQSNTQGAPKPAMSLPAGIVGLALGLLLCAMLCYSRQGSAQATRMPTVSGHLRANQPAISCEEYRQLKTQFESDARKITTGAGLGNFDEVSTTAINLGALGRGFIVEGSLCGDGNCGDLVYARGKTGYRKVLMAEGWGVAVAPSGGPVPDLVFSRHMSVAQTNFERFRYVGDKFVSLACESVVGMKVTPVPCPGMAFPAGRSFAADPSEMLELHRSGITPHDCKPANSATSQ